MSLRSVNSLQRVAFLFLALFVLCSRSESNECLKDGKVSGDCPLFSATLVRPGNFLVTLKTDRSLSGGYKVEMTFGHCKFNVIIYNYDYGILIDVPRVYRPYAKYLSFKKSGTQLVSNEDNKVFCSGLCQGDCDIHFSWDVRPSTSKIYIDFGSLKLVDVRGSKELSVIAIATIIVGSVLLFLLLICGVAQFIYCCKCKKSKPQAIKPQEAKSKPSATKTIKQIDLQDKKSTSNEKAREEKTHSNEKARAKLAESITSKDLVSPSKIRKDKAAEFITSLNLKSPTKDKQKSSSSQKEKQTQEN